MERKDNYLMKFRFVIIFLSIFTIPFEINAQNGSSADTIKSEIVFEKVEIEAAFPGGETAWKRFLEKNLNPNIPLDNGAPVSIYTVIVQFIVDKEGKITDIKALTNHGYGMEEEVMRLIKKGPQWHPAIKDGKMVRAYRKQPITFLIQQEGFEITSETPYFLFIGVDNSISVSVDKIKSKDLRITISRGSIESTGDGNYIIRVNTPGQAIIEVYHSKKEKKIGVAAFQAISQAQYSEMLKKIKNPRQ